MPEEGNKVLKYNHGEKSIKAPLIIYADLECLLEKISTCHNNLEQSYTEKKKLFIKLLVIQSLHNFHLIQQNITQVVIGKDSMERFCEDLKKHAAKIINYEKKK